MVCRVPSSRAPRATAHVSVLQVDDLFLATEEPFVTTRSYRMTAADSKAIATYAANVPGMPAGSSFRVLASPLPPPDVPCKQMPAAHDTAPVPLLLPVPHQEPHGGHWCSACMHVHGLSALRLCAFGCPCVEEQRGCMPAIAMPELLSVKRHNWCAG
jgi:hypothetical protein